MIGIAIFFIVLGILIKHLKMYSLLAGYNTMSKEEKENYDIVGVATVFRNVMFSMASTILIGFYVGQWIENPQIETYSFGAAMIIGIPYLLIKSNSKKFKINKD